MEYILRTETRSLGGIAPLFRARIIRQVLHYKNLAVLKGSVAANVAEPAGIPENGNVYVSSRDWTSTEQKKVDDLLKMWARWEVSYIHQFVKSTKCEGMTKNAGTRVCEECRKLASDESLKRSIRRVST